MIPQTFTPAVPGSLGFLQRLEPTYFKQAPIVTPQPGIEKGVLKLFGSVTLLSVLGGQLLGNGAFQVGPVPPTVTPSPGIEQGILPLFGSVTLLSKIGGQLGGSSGGQPQPVPPPTPPPPTPAYAMPLLNRDPKIPGLDQRMQRFVNNLSSMWNSLVRQSILVQTGPEDFTIRIPAGGGVLKFNGRTGLVTLQAADVTGALGYTPLPAIASGVNPGTYSNPTITINSFGQVTFAATGSGGSLAIGQSISGALNNNNLLYVDTTGKLQNAQLLYSAGRLTIPQAAGFSQVAKLRLGFENTSGATGFATMSADTVGGINFPVQVGAGSFVASGSVAAGTFVAGAYLEASANPTTVAGSTSGSTSWVMPQRGAGFKVFVAFVNNMAGHVTITYSIAFGTANAVWINTNTGGITVAPGLTTVTITCNSAATGWVIIGGF